MKLFFGGLATETNSFSPIPIGLESFEALRGPAVAAEAIPVRARELGLDVVCGLYAHAAPGGLVRRDVYESLRDELLDQLRAAGPVDIVALSMHGAMMAFGYDDCEGDILARVREIVGPSVTVGAVFDPHSHLSPEMQRYADALLFYRENPHTDIDERSRELVDLLVRIARREVRAETSVFDCRMADVFQTNREPMRSFVDRMRALERGNVLSISVCHSWRRGDVPFMGTKIVVITDNARAKGDALAERLGMELFSMRGIAHARAVPLEEAVERVLAAKHAPILLADISDNPDCGAPGDATYAVRALLDAGVSNIAWGALWDPLATRFAVEAGVGARLSMRIGGKACALSGEPLDLDVVVKAVNPHAKQTTSGGEIPMGTTAALVAEGLEIVVTDHKRQTFGPDLFTDLGVDLATKRVIVVKSAQHYRIMFEKHFAEDIPIDSPGVCISDIRKLPLKRIPRPMWPFDEHPFGEKKASQS
jgi:microcystin degradation protein MlrC